VNLLEDYWPCPPESAEYALITASRCPWLLEWGFTDGRIWWRIDRDDPAGDAACKHLRIKRQIQKSISLHVELDWEE
jgi:hypothetical protein